MSSVATNLHCQVHHKSTSTRLSCQVKTWPELQSWELNGLKENSKFEPKWRSVWVGFSICSLFLTFVSHTCDNKFSLFTERIIEDHEKLISVMMNWLKISNNKILFLETDDKYDLFFQPQVITLQWIQTVTLWGEDKSTGEDTVLLVPTGSRLLLSRCWQIKAISSSSVDSWCQWKV